jgi:hypothetical protein
MKQITVKHLIAILKQCNPKSIIVLSRDPEGNGFSPIAEDISIGKFVPENPNHPYRGEWEDTKEEVSTAICLWPID